MSYWERCPKCGSLGKIDKEQKQGIVSIICSECGYHYHSSASTVRKQDE